VVLAFASGRAEAMALAGAPQPRVRLKERFAPGPAAGEVEAQPAGEAAGDVEEPVAETLRLAAGELAREQQPLRPGEQVLRDQDELEPGGVRLKARKGRLLRPVSLLQRIRSSTTAWWRCSCSSRAIRPEGAGNPIRPLSCDRLVLMDDSAERVLAANPVESGEGL
jgi:hypothetical protein